MKKKIELVFIPMPGANHLPSFIQLANLLSHRDPRLSITILIIPISLEPTSKAQLQSLSNSSTAAGIHFIFLPDDPLRDTANKGPLIFKYAQDAQKTNVIETVAKLPQLSAFVLDMFCADMKDVANQFGVPSYIFYTSGAGYLSFIFHLQRLYDRDGDQYLHSGSEMKIPSFSKPIPSKAVPWVFSMKDIGGWIHENTRKFRETSGVLVNSFFELETQALKWFSDERAELPEVYAVGPILDLEKKGSDSNGLIKWLDEQPPSSVVFLCFGSRGSIKEDQAREIAKALEQSGHRFLWSLRRPPPAGTNGLPSEYEDFKDVLPEGFLERTAGVGKVIGWAPQVEILAHPATGAFVSHCGWNSTLESMWYGIPMGTWPLYAEQHFNAFELVEELGLAVEIGDDTEKGLNQENGVTVSAEKIESGIRKLMEGSEEVRELVKTRSEEARKSIVEGGSSFTSLNRFIDDVVANCP